MTARLCVLISGNGTNLQALIDGCDSNAIDATIELVVSNRAEAYGLERARRAGIPTRHVPVDGRDRADYDAALAAIVGDAEPDWVVLAGWMRVLTMAFLGEFPSKVVNLHPALPGCFAGTDAIERAHAAFGRGEIDRTGAMTHLVPDEQVDAGPVLDTIEVDLRDGEPLDALSQRMHAAEHTLLVRTLQRLCSDER